MHPANQMARQMARRPVGDPKSKRIVIQPPRGLLLGDQNEAEWESQARQYLQSRVRKYPVVRLTDDGPDYGGRLPRPGDEIGYGMHPYRWDDCLAAAVATAIQLPIESVPDLRIDDRLEAGEPLASVSDSIWETLTKWVASRGYVLTFHEQVPLDRDRWIGVCDGDPSASGHCLVMRYAQLLFDPNVSTRPMPGMAHRVADPAEITYGISFERREQ